MSTSGTMAFVLLVTASLTIVCVALIACWIQQRRAIWSLPIALCGLVATLILTGAVWWLWAIIAFVIILFLWFFWKAHCLNKQWFKAICIVLMCGVLIYYGVTASNILNTLHSGLPAPNKSTAVTKDSSSNDNEKKVTDDLEANGWKQTDYSVNSNVDASVDKSTAGAGRYSKKRVQSAEAMTSFLGSKSDGAPALLDAIMHQTKAKRDQILDPKNWVTVQSMVAFNYPGNTSFVGGHVVKVGNRQGDKGDIFIAFASSTGKIVYVRGACGNFQVVAPVPKTNKTSHKHKPYLEPKNASQDVGANPKVAPWKKDNTGGDASKGHQISNADGSKVANGYQADPKKDAAEAAKEAAAQAATKETTHQQAVTTATTVDSNQTHTSTSEPDW